MSFWDTAAAAFVGGLGVLLLASLVRLGWFFFKARFTAFGRLQTKAGMSIEEALREAERREREPRT